MPPGKPPSSIELLVIDPIPPCIVILRLAVQLLHTLTDKRNDAEYTATPHTFHQAKQHLALFFADTRKRAAGLQWHAQWLLWRGRDAAHRLLAIGAVRRRVQRGGETAAETSIRKRERFSHELTLAYENGQIVELKENERGPADQSKEMMIK